MDPNDGKDVPDANGDDIVIESEEDIGAHFEEFASASEAPADAAATNAEADPDDEAEEPELQAPEPKPGATITQAAPENGPAGEPSNDPWADAPAVLKAEHDRLKHQLASTSGRLSAADRRLAELVKAQEASPQGDKGGGDKPDSRAAEQPASIRDNPKVKALLEDYADVAGPLVEIIEAQQQQLADLAKPIQALSQDRSEAQVEAQMQVLNGRHPDLTTVINDPRYVDWLSTQPRAVKEAYERNQTQVVDGEEAAWVLDQFKRDVGIETSATPPPTPSPTPTPTPTPSGSAADVASKRQRQLDGNKDSGGSRGTAQPDADPDDLDALFNQAAAKVEKRRQQALGSV